MHPVRKSSSSSMEKASIKLSAKWNLSFGIALQEEHTRVRQRIRCPRTMTTNWMPRAISFVVNTFGHLTNHHASTNGLMKKTSNHSSHSYNPATPTALQCISHPFLQE